MALFENFPYTNLHELNLDWLIQEMKDLEQKVQDGPVISVNGLTGEVILYRQPNVQLPDITDPTVTHWEIFRYLNGNIYGIQFDNNGNVYALRDFVRTKLLTWDDIPPEAGVISVNGLYGVVHLSGTDIPYMGGETETVYDKLSDLDDAVTSAQADINDMMVTFSTIDNAIKSGLVYFEAEDTAVNNIPSGKYIFWKNGAYTASTAISAGDTLSTTNLSAVGTEGIINALKADLQNQIDTLSSKTTSQASSVFTPSSGIVVVNGTLPQTKRGNVAMLSFSVKKSDESAFTGNRVSVGSLAIGWIPNNRLIVPIGGSEAINGYTNITAGNMFIDIGGGINVDLAVQTVKELHIDCTFVIA